MEVLSESYFGTVDTMWSEYCHRLPTRNAFSFHLHRNMMMIQQNFGANTDQIRLTDVG